MKKLMNFFRSRKFGVIGSFSLLRVCKSTKIPFISENGLAIEWNSKNLTELLKRESDEFVLNHEGDKNDSGVIFLKGDLTIEVHNETRDNWLINFVETIETNFRKATIDMTIGVVKLINNSSLMNTSVFNGFVEVSNKKRDTGCFGDFGNIGTGVFGFGLFTNKLSGKAASELIHGILNLPGSQDIYAAGSESRPPMLNKENYVPWSSRLLRYAKSRPNGKLIHNSILNGPYVRRMIPEPGDAE
nr:ribonuclease H-like domain-containing protein [Tanacetum cinerariifolium]